MARARDILGVAAAVLVNALGGQLEHAVRDREGIGRSEALIAARFPSRLWAPGEQLPTLYRPVGCSACSKTGYKGRLALHEVMLISEEIERLAVEKASATTIEHVAREQGMKTLREDGLSKVLAGVTSLDEILRVVV